MPELTKRDVEALFAVLANPPNDLAAEVDGLRSALATALAKLLGEGATGRPGSWDGLVRSAAAVGGWEADRVTALTDRDDLERARQAMWDLAAELNEQRSVGRSPGIGPAGGRQQREVVSAIERAVAAVRDRDAAAVRKAAGSIRELDGAGRYPAVPAALDRVATEIDSGGGPSGVALAALEAALGPGPLAAEVARIRGA